MILDIIIVLLVISAVFRGREIGFVRQLLSTVGFLGGLYLGTRLERLTIHFATDQSSEVVIALVTVITTALLALVLTEQTGIRLKYKVLHKPINRLDNASGSVVSVASTLITVWFLAALATSLPSAAAQQFVAQSKIVGYLNRALPSAPKLLDNIGQLVDPNGFPKVFIGIEPNPKNVALPNLGDLQAAVTATRASVVKVEGRGCGGIVEGSGFVTKNGFVATNAHVVAGINRPVVKDSNGSHTAVPVWFDPDMDLAVLRTSDLAGPALPLDISRAPSGTPAAVLGYPGGGPLNAGAAAVLDSFTASGRNIYNRKAAARDVYELRADVIPGNSGGPLINQAGKVIGVIFAESTTYDHVGYALTAAEVQPEIAQAIAQNHAASTGTCAE
ncbi:MAG: serine protease [Candidatus Saccharibacteria bacterium]|nr:serine protease [Candidatus Saccharibacteria bacterium]